MSTSDTSLAQQGRKQRHTTRTPSATTTHSLSNYQAHSSNSHATMNYYSSQPTTPPRTPRRTDALSAVPAETNGYTSNDAHSAPPNSSAKPKSRTKNRPKNVVTSPSTSRAARVTPPLTGAGGQSIPKPAKTPASLAYAGPTFHASPAPSALPLPSFYSKSVPESPAPIGMKSAKDDTSSDASDSPTPPTTQMKGLQCQREESPLDFFFNADRAERARVNGSSSGAGPFQPPFESPLANHTPPNLPRAHSDQFSGGHASSMFAMELESTNSPGKPFGAPFATPYSERIKAARSQSQSQPLKNNSQDSPVNSSQALRDYLFTGNALATPKSSPVGSSIRSTSGPTTPVGGMHPAARQPNHSYHSDFPFGNESIPYNRGSSRTSGLRQEVSQNKTPVKRTDASERVTSAPPKMSTNPFFVNNASTKSRVSQKSASSSTLPNGGTPERARSHDLLDLEDRLRRQLNLEPASAATKSSDNGFPFASSQDSVSGYRSASMNGAYNNGVIGS